MPVRQYGSTQVVEMRFTEQEVRAIVAENIRARADPSYDFDSDNPIVLRDGTDLIFRFVQNSITREPNSSKITLSAMPAPAGINLAPTKCEHGIEIGKSARRAAEPTLLEIDPVA